MTKKKPRNRNIAQEFAEYFGNESKLANWQMLCEDIGIEGDLSSLTKCRAALKKVWVNIYDLIDAKATGGTVRTFENQKQLSKYTIKNNKTYPRDQAKMSGPVRLLLRHIF